MRIFYFIIGCISKKLLSYFIKKRLEKLFTQDFKFFKAFFLQLSVTRVDGGQTI